MSTTPTLPLSLSPPQNTTSSITLEPTAVPSDFKPYVIEWIKDDAIKATKIGSKMAVLYNRILGQVKRFPDPIIDTRTLKLIRYIGVKTAESLRDRVLQLCKDNEWEPPHGFLDEVEARRKALSSRADEAEEQDKNRDSQSPEKRAKKAKRARSTANYVPKHRSGAFAIMITLYLQDGEGHGMTRDQITSVASKYCDKSFTVSNTAFHSAWDSIKTLMTKDLVYSTGRSPKYYFLTEEGKELATKLKEAVDIESSPLHHTMANTSYDNGLRLDTTYEQSSPISNKMTSEITTNGLQRVVQQDTTPILSNFTHVFGAGENAKTSAKKSAHDASSRTYEGTKYEIWSRNEYDIVLYIDNREVRSKQERDFFQRKVEGAGVVCDAKSLSCGDTIWVAKHKQTGKEAVLNYLCERKRIDDLCDSIRDGRFQEQKNRMKKTGISHCYYLVEEVSFAKERGYSTLDSVQTSISQIMTNANIYLRRFKDIDETTDFLVLLTKVIEERMTETNLIVLKPRDIENQEQYHQLLISFRHKFEARANYECAHLFSSFQNMLGKTSQMTVKELFILMLMTIKGCSLEKAVVIQSRFPTPKNLIEFYHVQHAQASVDSKKVLLSDEFKHQVGNKKIGKVLLEKVYDVWGSV